jgi:hypothetical protein
MSKQSDTQQHTTTPVSSIIDAPAGVTATLVANPNIVAKTTHNNSGQSINKTVGSNLIVNPS